MPFKNLVMRLFKIPPDPLPPAGSEASVRVFRAAPNYYRYALARWGVRQVGVLIGFIVVFAFFTAPFVSVLDRLDPRIVREVVEKVPGPVVNWAERLRFIERIPASPDPDSTDSEPQTRISFGPAVFWLELFGVVLFLIQLPISYAIVRLDYELRWYIVTDRSLRIREGVRAIHETTMTFANVQNLSVKQGPIQRLLGIADLQVRTAGGGGGSSTEASSQHGNQASESLHVAYFRGVNNAAEIRDTILARLRSLKDAGLGEPDDTRAASVLGKSTASHDGVVQSRPSTVPTGQAIAAARKVLDEARALRVAIAVGGTGNS